MIRSTLAAVILALIATACANPTPESVVIAKAVQATLTAVSPRVSETSAPPSAVPTLAPSSTTALLATQRPVPTATHTSTPTPMPTETPAPTNTLVPTAIPSATATATSGVPIAAASKVVNLRSGPGTNYPVVGGSKVGSQYEITGRNEDGTWLEVCCVKDKPAWVAKSVVAVIGDAQKIALAKNVPPTPEAPAPTPKPAADKRDLEVSFINPHYDCQQEEWQYTGDDGVLHPLWGYRSFQVDMYIKNNSDSPVNPPWRPYRWTITDGNQDVQSGMMWQWLGRGGFINQPVIQPGQSAGWTFLAFPLDRNQWVKDVAFVWGGQLYHQAFDLGPYGNSYNYKDCGFVRSHTERSTPTPRP